MTSLALTVVLTVLVGLGGAVLHELTHWLVARLGHRNPVIRWRELNCYHEMPLAGPTALDYAVGVAPFAIGGVVALGWVALSFDVTLPLLVGWAIYTLNGIPNDFRIQPTEPPDIY